MKNMLAVAVTVLTLSCLAQSDRAQTSKRTNVTAMVLGKHVTATGADDLRGLILQPLLDEFAQQNNIKPTDEELDALISRTKEAEKHYRLERQEERSRLIQELNSQSLSAVEREKKKSRLDRIEKNLKWMDDVQKKGKETVAEERVTQRKLAEPFVKSWKINKALYQKYGGRVVFQQAGAEPLDAYRDFLKEQAKMGAFQIINKGCAAAFWGYFTNNAAHTFYSKEEGAKFISTPWWTMAEPPEKSHHSTNRTGLGAGPGTPQR